MPWQTARPVDAPSHSWLRAFSPHWTWTPLTLQALLTVIETLHRLPMGAKMQFFLGRQGSLGGLTPLEALERGQLEKVQGVALAFAASFDFEPPKANITGRPVVLED